MTEEGKYRILAIPSDLSGGGVGAFRSFGPHTYLQEHYGDEFVVDIMAPKDMDLNDITNFFKKYDLIVFHKELPKGMLDTIKFLGLPTICDIDDNPILTPAHPMYISWKRENWHESIAYHLKNVDYITTTTPIFAKMLKKYNKNVSVLPNAIDVREKQFSSEKTPSDKLRFGIVCGSTHQKDIELIKKLDCLPQEVKDKSQIVLCGYDTRGITTIHNTQTGEVTKRPIRPEESVWARYEEYLTNNYKEIKNPEYTAFLKQYIQGVDTPEMYKDEWYRRQWTKDIHHYGEHYKNVDVLLAPLDENVFNEVKSQLKFIEAGFTNCAIIASDFGPYTIDSKPYIKYGGEVDPEGNCLLVPKGKSHKLWAKYITYLVQHPEAVETLKKNLRKDMMENYSLEKVTKERAELYKKVIEEHKAKM